MPTPERLTEGPLSGYHPRRVPGDELTLDLPTLARGLGYRPPATRVGEESTKDHPDGGWSPQVAEIAAVMLAQGRRLIAPRWLWVPVSVAVDTERNTVICLAPYPATLSVGRIVRAQLRGARAAAAFVVTIGPRLEAKARAMMKAGEFVEGYVLDTVGSMAVEAAADVLEAEVARSVADLGWKTTHRFSPGYCTWETSDQKSLFSLFPERPAGVTLSPSSLMSPLKSISGLIGLGDEVERRPYLCDLCSMETCHQCRPPTRGHRRVHHHGPGPKRCEGGWVHP